MPILDKATGKPVISPLDMSTLLFELTTPNGETYKIYLNGKTEGFPDGTLIVNHAFPLFCAGVKNIQTTDISDK